MEKMENDEKLAMKVSANSILVNLLLSLFKLMAGFLAGSSAIISDGVHSASDVLSTFVVIIGVKVSGKESDDDHPYGHERFECVAALILSVMLALTGAGIGIAGINKLIDGTYAKMQIPGLLALIAAVVSIITKEGMYWYTRAAAKKINSGALMADAWHHRSDALSSIGSFIGVLFARMGYPIMDPLASVVISFFIIKAAFEIFMDAINKMTDHSISREEEEEMEKKICEVEGVLGIDLIKTRTFGSKIYVDVEIKADGNKTLYETHDIAENVHDMLEEKFPAIKHCMVHVNPV